MMDEFKLVRDIETGESLLYVPFYTINGYLYKGYFIKIDK